MLIKSSDNRPVVPCLGGNILPYKPDQLISLCQRSEIGYKKGVLQYEGIKHKVDRYPSKMIVSGYFIVLVYDKYFCVFFENFKWSIPYYIQPESDFMVYATSDKSIQRIINGRKIYEIFEGIIIFLGEVKPNRTIIYLSEDCQLYIKKAKVYEKKGFGKKSKKKCFDMYTIGNYYICYVFLDIGELGIILDNNFEMIGPCFWHDDYIECCADVDKIEHDDQYIVFTFRDGDQLVYGRYDNSHDCYVRLTEKDAVSVKK